MATSRSCKTVRAYSSESMNSCACSDHILSHGWTRRSKTSVHAKHVTKGLQCRHDRMCDRKRSREECQGLCVLGVGEDRLVLFLQRMQDTRADTANGSACVVLCRRGHVIQVLEAREELPDQEVPRAPPSRCPGVCHCRCLGACQQQRQHCRCSSLQPCETRSGRVLRARHPTRSS